MSATRAEHTTGLRLALLGPPGAWRGDEPIAIPRRQTRALLFRLAAQATPLPREQLCYLFWPDETESTARRALAHLLTHLRRALPDPSVLVSVNDQVGLDPGKAWSDMVVFDRLLTTPDPRERTVALQRAAELPRGPFLDGFSLPDCPEFEQWAARERQSVERRWLEALGALIEHHSARGALPQAIEAAKRYLAADELAEDIHRRLIALYAMNGDRAAALRQTA